MRPVIAIGNQKGGVTKTTTALIMARLLGKLGYRVGLVDLDPQMSATESCGLSEDQVEGRSVAECLKRKGAVSLDKIMLEIASNVWFAPSHIDDLTQAQRELLTVVGRDTKLRRVLEQVEGIDIFILDCPPNLEMLTVNALAAATHVIIPVKPVIQDLRGLRLFLKTLWEVNEVNPGIYDMKRVLFTFYKDYNEHKRALAVVQGDGLEVFDTKIGESVQVAEGPGVYKTIVDYSPHNPRVAEYERFTQEVLEWLQIRN